MVVLPADSEPCTSPSSTSNSWTSWNDRIIRLWKVLRWEEKQKNRSSAQITEIKCCSSRWDELGRSILCGWFVVFFLWSCKLEKRGLTGRKRGKNAELLQQEAPHLFSIVRNQKHMLMQLLAPPCSSEDSRCAAYTSIVLRNLLESFVSIHLFYGTTTSEKNTVSWPICLSVRHGCVPSPVSGFLQATHARPDASARRGFRNTLATRWPGRRSPRFEDPPVDVEI
jgi:hypothetical protein